MDYTQSDSFFTHTGTGQRMHKEVQPVPTAWSDKDGNSIMWSLMEIIKDAGLAGVQFDPDAPESYRVLVRAIYKLITSSSSDGPGRASIFLQPNPPAKHMRFSGALLSRTVYPELWEHVQTVGAVSEAEWTAGRWGWFSSGDGSTTFRIPLIGGESLRFLDEGRGIDPGRLIGSWQDGANAAHTHGVTDPQHNHAVTDPTHSHTGVTLPGGAHDHGAPKLPPRVADVDATGTTPSLFSTDSESTLAGAPDHTHNVNVGSSSTGISIQNRATGITIVSQGSEARMRNIAWPIYLKYEW